MIEQPQVNIKTLPPHPSAEDLYNYYYNRKARRSHSPEKKAELKRKLWESYKRQLKEMEAAMLKMKEDKENGREDATLHDEEGSSISEEE